MDEYAYGTNASGGVGLGGTYNEYRSLSTSSAGTAQDEELQVWTWGNSYATQYRDVTAGGEASHQAWSFGGTKTPKAAMDAIVGDVSYTGKFGATAKTSNWVDSTLVSQTVSHNNIWRVEGDSSLTANFGTGAFSGTLTPQLWNAYQTMNGASGFHTIDLSAPLDANYAGFMSSNIVLKGTITNNITTGNSITGTAEMDTGDGWLTNSTTNPMYAGVFGANADEITGAFALEATAPAPLGGNLPINDDRRGYIEMSGVFNGQ